jgi:DNA-binding response OmpR family regulator
MPVLDGWQMLERIRQVSNVPVIMLTGLNVGEERIRGLRGGADDYVGKPYTPGELLARIEAVLRRSVDKPSVRDVYDDGSLTIDFETLDVTARSGPVSLTPLEFRLLTALVDHPGQVLSRLQLLELAWDEPFAANEEQVNVYVGYLRKKIELDPSNPELIETARGFGYRYCPPS